MNGADAIIATLLAEGVEVCFANPGTTELPLVLALDKAPGMRPVLCLHENVATGAADGYARMTGKPAMCLLHLGPGLANGLTNLHNARRASTPIVNVIGQHASWHVAADPLLASDVASLARWAGTWVKECASPQTLAADTRAAIAAAVQQGGSSFLIVPHDVQMAEPVSARVELPVRVEKSYQSAYVAEAAKALKAGDAALLLGGAALTEAGLMLAGRIAAATGAELLCETFFPCMERGAGLPLVRRLPYFPDQALELTKRFRRVVIAGTRRPVAFFGYPGLPSHLTTEEQTLLLAAGSADVLGALAALAGAIKAPPSFVAPQGALPEKPKGKLDAHSVSAVIARLQPENAIVMDEALTVGVPYFEASLHAPRFTHLTLTGGAIGQGPGAATGAALACPGRKVINYQSDGCGAYSVQAFWTEAREKLDVVTIIGSNRSYNILNVEMLRAGVRGRGAASRIMTGLDNPYLDWVRIGEGFGVPSVAVESAEALHDALEEALRKKGPRLIEAIMP